MVVAQCGDRQRGRRRTFLSARAVTSPDRDVRSLVAISARVILGRFTDANKPSPLPHCRARCSGEHGRSPDTPRATRDVVTPTEPSPSRCWCSATTTVSGSPEGAGAVLPWIARLAHRRPRHLTAGGSAGRSGWRERAGELTPDAQDVVRVELTGSAGEAWLRAWARR
jgi:hypothetical protein